MKPLVGTVISTKMAKTVVVEVKRRFPHPLYKKLINKRKKIKAHNENLDIKVGDIIKIGEVPPISREKHFKVLEVTKLK
jgi:small subunit ribosomal protein S17